MLRVCVSLFLSGIVLGAGPCLVSCGPLLVTYIAGTNKGPKEGFLVWLVFSLARITAYCILALLVGLAAETAQWGVSAKSYLYLLGGAFVLLIGILTIYGKDFGSGFCGSINQALVKKGIKSSYIFGLITGFLPCGPLVSILVYIGMISRTWVNALLYGASFSLGTVISPLLILSIAAGYIPKFFLGHSRLFRWFQVACGVVICFLGINLIRNAF